MKKIQVLFIIFCLSLIVTSAYAAEFNLDDLYSGFSQRFDPYEIITQETAGPIDAIHIPAEKALKIPIGAEVFHYPKMALKLDGIFSRSTNIPGDLKDFYQKDFLEKKEFEQGTLWHFLNWRLSHKFPKIAPKYRNMLLTMDKSLLSIRGFLSSAGNKKMTIHFHPYARNNRILLAQKPTTPGFINASIKQKAFMLAHPDLDAVGADLVYSPEFEPEFNPLILRSGFSFWLSYLQNGLPNALIKNDSYNAHIFFIEWLTAIYYYNVGTCGLNIYDPNKLAQYISNTLKSLERPASARARLANENWEFQNYLQSDYYVDDEFNKIQGKQPGKLLPGHSHPYLDLITQRAEIRKKFEKSNILPAKRLKRLAISTSVALFTLFRMSDQTMSPYSNALARMEALEQTTGIVMRVDVLKNIFAGFILD